MTSLYRHPAVLNSGPVALCVALEGRSRGLTLWLQRGRDHNYSHRKGLHMFSYGVIHFLANGGWLRLLTTSLAKKHPSLHPPILERTDTRAIGRKLVFVFCILLMSITGIAQAISSNYLTFQVFVFINALGTAGVYPLAFIIALYSCKTSDAHRADFGILNSYILVGGVAPPKSSSATDQHKLLSLGFYTSPPKPPLSTVNQHALFRRFEPKLYSRCTYGTRFCPPLQREYPLEEWTNASPKPTHI
uniref:Uncharacterized protein n=1 Tax=Timema genevievae TaxID=629358 RepID=A0A7R9PMP2_TIMGE|nr:unnamed protein product [Timema genevievae]